MGGCPRASHCLHCWRQDKAKAQLCVRPHSTRLRWTAPRAGDEGACPASIARCRTGDSWGHRLRDASPSLDARAFVGVVLRPESCLRGVSYPQSPMGHPGEQQLCPVARLPTQHPLRRHLSSDTPGAPPAPSPCGCHVGTPFLRSALITFIQCNQGKESIDCLSSHFCQFFHRHH